MKIVTILAVFLSFSTVSHAEFVVEDASEAGVTGPSDSSWRYYLEQMDRFPDRLGFICYNAYILNKTPDHKSAFKFFEECANRGHAPSMINLAQFYTDGMGVNVDLAKAANWLRRGAETGHSAAEYEYGKTLMNGIGATKNEDLARFWLKRASVHGDIDATQILKSERIPVVAWIE